MLKRFFTSIAVLFCLLFAVAAPAQAADNVIDSIDIEVVVHRDGSASVTDRRAYTFEDATEHYIPFGDLGESEIVDVSVSQDGAALRESTPWDVDRSLEEKAGQFGIVDTGDGVEIAWGIGSEGTHAAEVRYRITNFVRALTDGSQAIYWQFLHEDMTDTNTVDVTVRNDTGFDFSSTYLHGYGFEGTTDARPGALKMTTESFSRVVMLAIMPPGTFTTSASWPWDTEGIKERANEGSDGVSPGVLAGIAAGIAALVAAVGAFMRSHLKKRPAKANGFSPSSRKVEHTTLMPDGEVLALSGLYRHSKDDLFGAYLLKWITGGNLIEESYEHGMVFKRDKPGLRIGQAPTFENDLERELWTMITAARGDDDFIEQSEINKHFAKLRIDFDEWSDKVRDFSTTYLADHGYTRLVRKTGLFPRDEYELTDLGQATVDQMDGFGKYLRDGWYPEAAPQPGRHLMWAGFLGALEETQDRLGESSSYYPTLYVASTMTQQAAQGFAPTGSSSGGGMGAAGAASGGGAR